MAGLRFDDDKNRLDLIPPEWILALGEVLTAGAKKYAERNWELGMNHSKMVGACFRHVFKYLMGERYDDKHDAAGRPGTGCHHLALAAWNLLALMSYDLRGLGKNDLPTVSLTRPTRVDPETGELS